MDKGDVAHLYHSVIKGEQNWVICSDADLRLQVALVVKNQPANSEDLRDIGSIPA